MVQRSVRSTLSCHGWPWRAQLPCTRLERQKQRNNHHCRAKQGTMRVLPSLRSSCLQGRRTDTSCPSIETHMIVYISYFRARSLALLIMAIHCTSTFRSSLSFGPVFVLLNRPSALERHTFRCQLCCRHLFCLTQALLQLLAGSLLELCHVFLAPTGLQTCLTHRFDIPREIVLAVTILLARCIGILER